MLRGVDKTLGRYEYLIGYKLEDQSFSLYMQIATCGDDRKIRLWACDDTYPPVDPLSSCCVSEGELAPDWDPLSDLEKSRTRLKRAREIQNENISPTNFSSRKKTQSSKTPLKNRVSENGSSSAVSTPSRQTRATTGETKRRRSILEFFGGGSPQS